MVLVQKKFFSEGCSISFGIQQKEKPFKMTSIRFKWKIEVFRRCSNESASTLSIFC